MAKNLDITLDQFIDLLVLFRDAQSEDAAPEPDAEPEKPAKEKGKKGKGKKDKKGKKGKKAKDDEAEPAAETEEVDEERKARLTATNIRTLRKWAKAAGYDAAAVDGAEKPQLVDSLMDEEFIEGFDEAPDEEADDAAEETAEEEAAEGEGGDEYTREELEGMNLTELKKIARDSGWTAADYKGWEQPDLVTALLGEEEEPAAEVYTKADFKAMDEKELRALAKDWDVKVKKGDDKKAVIKALIASQ